MLRSMRDALWHHHRDVFVMDVVWGKRRSRKRKMMWGVKPGC